MFKRATFLLITAILAIAPAARGAQVTTQPFQGITLIHRTETSPRKLDIWVAVIDTLAPGIKFHVTPESPHLDGAAIAQTTRSFVTQNGAQLGINGGFFGDAGTVNGLPHKRMSSLAVSAGNQWSSFGASEPGFNIGKNNVAHRVVSSSSVPLYNAIGGWAYLVNNGNVTTSWQPWQTALATELHPRTAMGLSQDRRYVTMFTVDGRQSHSGGMTFQEMGTMLRNDYGAYWAINLDGGGSTTIVMEDPNPNISTRNVLNKPSGGSERAVGNSWAVSARQTPAPVPVGALSRSYQQQSGAYSHAAAQLRSTSPTTNLGSTDSFRVGYDTSQGKTRGALSFDLAAIPNNATIHSVSLTLDCFESAGATGNKYVDLEVYKLSNNIVEGEVTWNQRAVGSNWTTPGGDMVGRSLSSLFGQQSTGLKAFVSTVDFVAAAQAAVATGTPLNLLVAALDAETQGASLLSNQNLRFRSDDATTGQRPMLTVQYTFTPPPGDANGDGFVDVLDFVVWRQSDGSTPGYEAWRANYNKTGINGGGAGSGTLWAVPEPTSLLLLAVGVLLAVRNYRRTAKAT